MKAARFYSANEVRVEEMELPSVGPEELLVRVWGTGLCSSDIRKITRESVPPGTVLGHEVVGVVEKVGENLDGFQLGQRVFLAHHVPCFSCHYCLCGCYTMCQSYREEGLYPGGFAEFVRASAAVTRHGTLLLPPQLSFEEAIFIEPLACCLRGLRRARLAIGDTLLIVGSGAIGMMLTQLAKSFHLKVLVSELRADRRELAMRMGSDAVVDPQEASLAEAGRELSDGRGVDAVIATVFSPEIMRDALAALRDGGVLDIFGAEPGSWQVEADFYSWWKREIDIIGSWSYEIADLHQVLGLLSGGEIRVRELLTHRLGLDRLLEGCELMRSGQALKVLIEIGVET